MVEIAAIAVLLILCCALLVVLLLQRQAKDNATTRAWKQGHEHGVAQGKAAAAQITQRLAAYEQLLRAHCSDVLWEVTSAQQALVAADAALYAAKHAGRNCTRSAESAQGWGPRVGATEQS